MAEGTEEESGVGVAQLVVASLLKTEAPNVEV